MIRSNVDPFLDYVTELPLSLSVRPPVNPPIILIAYNKLMQMKIFLFI